MKKQEIHNKNLSKPRYHMADNISGWGFIGVAVAVFVIFTLYPVISAVITSFQEYKPFGSEFVGFENYITALGNDLFWKSIKNTLVYTVVVIPLSLILSFSIAIMIVPFTKSVQSVFKGIYYLPGIASGVAISVVWLWLYDASPNGIFNRVLALFGATSQNWLSSSKTAMLSLIIMALLSSHGANIIIYIAALHGIDNTYYEAAEMDGAKFFQKIRYIVLPMCRPTTLFLLVTGVIGSFQVFMNAYMMTGGGPDNNTTMIGLLIFNNAFTYGKYGLACAQAILLAIVIAALTTLQFKLMGEDIEY
ncbi:carbohydrate ABC transporter membrane protein 1, CUT1 family [Butyrivibrio proteoclasticus]|uniref:Carbohydrate ABC transporter membrane protein 1, CUT1 family n=1 Tax=Butyrivibrio proteoclasticus TaxID=43305 RepID=A0A1I5V8P8_9FIRM|nr:sugar ABC transporter permease [Butyrivibrio proteoclasticus]SFQ03875.1 carbohydrate ABC transporter membrane protein 1, CUT1 family [Butyrivibrio proteoclasticus]